MTNESRECLEMMAESLSLSKKIQRSIVEALVEIDRLSSKLASAELAESALEELGQQLTEAAQSLGIDPDGLSDSETLRAVVSGSDGLP